MKKIELGSLKVQSFTTTLSDQTGLSGVAINLDSVTCPANPKTDEPKESTCTTSPSDTTGGSKCGPHAALRIRIEKIHRNSP